MVQVGIGFRRTLDVLVIVDLNGIPSGVIYDRPIVCDEDFVLAEVWLGAQALLPVRAKRCLYF